MSTLLFKQIKELFEAVAKLNDRLDDLEVKLIPEHIVPMKRKPGRPPKVRQ